VEPFASAVAAQVGYPRLAEMDPEQSAWCVAARHARRPSALCHLRDWRELGMLPLHPQESALRIRSDHVIRDPYDAVVVASGLGGLTAASLPWQLTGQAF
jgi:hypothetical protein